VKAAAGAATASASACLRELQTIDSTARNDMGPLPARTPTFCPGCPHRDTAALCVDVKTRFMDARYMATGTSAPRWTCCSRRRRVLRHAHVRALQQHHARLQRMGVGGGTGVGTDRFVRNKEAVFMGDGTFFHSGQLAVGQAIKLGQDITSSSWTTPPRP